MGETRRERRMKRRLMPRIAASLGLTAGLGGNASANDAVDRNGDPGFWDSSTRPDHGQSDLGNAQSCD